MFDKLKVAQDKNYISYEQCIEFMTNILPEPISKDQAQFCFGMSKQTVAKDKEFFKPKNMILYKVEFIELLCRIAQVK